MLSLDFELGWGNPRRTAEDPRHRQEVLGARSVVRNLLQLFQEFDVAATWAVVGMLLSEGMPEREDPLHYGGSLVRAIAATPRQEVGSHTYSHYLCLCPGSTKAAFQADLEAARIASERFHLPIRSLVFPRNQHALEYEEALLAVGISTFRGNPPSWMWRFDSAEDGATPVRRLARFADAYLPFLPSRALGWSDVLQSNGLANVRASFFLRPYVPRLRHLEPLRLRRLKDCMTVAARRQKILHLWWHPHNFGLNQKQNLAFLRALLEHFRLCREMYGMESLTMEEVGRCARQFSQRANTSA